MDPDECLKQLLAFADKVMQEEGDSVASAELVDFMDKLYGLDQWLKGGGFMPKRWTTANGSIFERVDAALELLSLMTKTKNPYTATMHFALPRVLEAILRGTRLARNEAFDPVVRVGLSQMRLLWPQNYRFWKSVKVSDI
jgi:hypothetical protein